MSNENDWRSTDFRRRVVVQLDNLIRLSAAKTQRSAEELESQVYSRSTNRGDYLQYIARVVLILKQNLTHSGRQHLNRISNESQSFGYQHTGDNLTGSSAVDHRNNLQDPNVSLSWQNGPQINQIQGKSNITLSKVAQNGEQFNIQMSVANMGGGGGSSQQYMTPPATLNDIHHRIPSPSTNGINYRTPSPANGINQVSPSVTVHHRSPSAGAIAAGLVQHRVPSPAAAVAAPGIMQQHSPVTDKSQPDIIVPVSNQWPRPMQISDDWKSWRTRQRVIQQLNDLIQHTPQTLPRRDAQRLESQVFQRSKQREEYLQYIARIVMRLRQSAQAGGHQQQQQQQPHQNNHQQIPGNISHPGTDSTLIGGHPNNLSSNLLSRLSNNVSSPEVLNIPNTNGNGASGSQTENQTPLLQQSLQQLRQVKNSDDWKTRTFRQRIIHQLEELNRWTPSTARRSPEELESQIFQRSTSKEDYMRYIGKVVLHMRQIKQANDQHSYNTQQGTNNSQSSTQSSSLQSHLRGSVQQPQIDLTTGQDDQASLSSDLQMDEQQSENPSLYVQQMGNGSTAGVNNSQLRELLSPSSREEGSSVQNINPYSTDHNHQVEESQRTDLQQSNTSFDSHNETREEDIYNKSEILSRSNEKINTSYETESDEYEKASDSPGAFQLLLLGD